MPYYYTFCFWFISPPAARRAMGGNVRDARGKDGGIEGSIVHAGGARVTIPGIGGMDSGGGGTIRKLPGTVEAAGGRAAVSGAVPQTAWGGEEISQAAKISSPLLPQS
jgi:hypothetical protein